MGAKSTYTKNKIKLLEKIHFFNWFDGLSFPISKFVSEDEPRSSLRNFVVLERCVSFTQWMKPNWIVTVITN